MITALVGFQYGVITDATSTPPPTLPLVATINFTGDTLGGCSCAADATYKRTNRETDGQDHCVKHPLYGSGFGVARWLSGRASDLRSKSRGFEARPRRCCATTLGKLFTPYTASVTKQYNLVPAKAGK